MSEKISSTVPEDRTAPDDGAKSRAIGLGIPVGLFAVAVAMRVLPIRSVLGGNRTYLVGNDAYYHLRRIEYALSDFPRIPGFDPYVNHPFGGEPIWPKTFDLGVALLTRPFVDLSDRAGLEFFVVWLPPILGGLTVVALYSLMSRAFDRAVAVASALILSVLSAHVWYSQIGFVDHHAAVALVSTLLLASAMGVGARGPRWGRYAIVGLWMAASLLIWPGALLHVSLVAAFMGVTAAMRPTRADALAEFNGLAVAFGVAGLAIAPFSFGQGWILWSAFSPVVLSSFQLWGFVAAFSGAVALAALSRSTRLGDSRFRRAAGAAGVAAVILTASAMAIPEFASAILDAWSWMARDEGFQASVGESVPLLGLGPEPDFGAAELRLSRLIYLFPIAWMAMLIRTRRRSTGGLPTGVSVGLLLAWTAGLALAAGAQLRFMNTFSVGLAAATGWGAMTLIRALPEGVRRRGPRLVGLGAALIAVALFVLAPMWPAYQTHLRNLYSAARGGPLLLTPPDLMKRSLVEVAEWLGANSPRTRGYLDASLRPQYGVLSSWTAGHVLRYHSRRPMVRDNFGDDAGAEGFFAGLRYFEGGERRANRLADELGIRFVIVQPQIGAEIRKQGGRTMFERLYRFDGAGTPAANAGSSHPLNGLGRHRLVYESSPVPKISRPGQPAVKAFEVVPGANLIGQTTPGTLVEIRLQLETNTGRSIEYRAASLGDESGAYRFALPYSNQGGPAGVSVAAHYSLSCPGDRAQLSLTESDVWSSENLDGPPLCVAAQR